MKKTHQTDLKKIRKAIPYGIMKEIAENAEVSQSVLSQWFNGDFNSRRIEECVLKEYQKQKQLEEKRQKRFKMIAT